MPEEIPPQQVDTKEYVANYPGFRINSGITVPDGDMKGRVIDLSMYTDEAQGFAWYKDGYHKQVTQGTSYDISGIRIVQKGPIKQYSKIITAVQGHILIDAQDGDVLIKGRNVRLESTGGNGEITLKSTKFIQLDASVLNLRGTNMNVLATNNISMGGNFIELSGGVGVEAGTQTDIFQAPFFGSIMKWLDKFKDFL